LRNRWPTAVGGAHGEIMRQQESRSVKKRPDIPSFCFKTLESPGNLCVSLRKLYLHSPRWQ